VLCEITLAMIGPMIGGLLLDPFDRPDSGNREMRKLRRVIGCISPLVTHSGGDIYGGWPKNLLIIFAVILGSRQGREVRQGAPR
jgi:hypothetical protein